MYRGTTPKLEFELQFDTSFITDGYLTLQQKGVTVIEKSIQDCVLVSNIITCALTQADTLALTDKEDVSMQLRLKLNNGEVIASEIMYAVVEKILKEGEI